MYRADAGAPTEPYDPRNPYAPQSPQSPQSPQPTQPPPSAAQPPAPDPTEEIPPLGALGASAGTPALGASPTNPYPERGGHAQSGYAPAYPPAYPQAASRQPAPPAAETPAASGYVDPRLRPMAPPGNAGNARGAPPYSESPYPASATPAYEQSPGIPVAPAPEAPVGPTPRQPDYPDYEALIYEAPPHRRHAAAPYDPYQRGAGVNGAEPVQPLRATPRGLYAWNGMRVTHFVLGVVEVLLAIRFVLMLFAANSTAPFARLVFGGTFPLVAPFNGVFPEGGGGGHIFDATAILAGIIYALLAWGITSLLHLEDRRRNPMAPIDPLIPPQEPPPTPPSPMDDSMLP